MIKIKRILRSLWRNPLNTSIIIISLAIGIVSSSQIATFILRELGTDSFHTDVKSIYSLQADNPFPDKGRIYMCREGAAEYMVENIPQIEDFCRIAHSNPIQRVTVNNQNYSDQPICIAASSNFFSFFSYKIVAKGSQPTLETLNSLVISEEFALKYFGATNPLGRLITLSDRNEDYELVITGVYKKPTENSQLQFDMVRLSENTYSRCYVRLTPNANIQELEKLFLDKKDVIPIIHVGTPGQYYLEPFTDTYFNTSRLWEFEANRDPKDIWIAAAIGLILLIVALFNYIGLINNNLFTKSKELKIRRLNGSKFTGLIAIVMAEYATLIGISFLLSLYLTIWIKPYFSIITGSDLTSTHILQSEQTLTFLVIIGLILLITFLFAYYHIKLSLGKYTPRAINLQFGRKVQLPAFNIIQLATSIALASCTFVIARQMSFISNKSIGFNKGVIEVSIPIEQPGLTSAFKQELLNSASVESVSITTSYPLRDYFMTNLEHTENGETKQFNLNIFDGDEDFITTLGIPLVEGEGFANTPQNNKGKCLVTEYFAKLFPNQNLVGKPLPGMEHRTVIGIVRDFHYQSLKQPISPSTIFYNEKGSHLLVKAKGNQANLAINEIKRIWENLIPEYPHSIQPLGDRYEWLHRENTNFILLVGSCNTVSIFLSMIGLFAVAFQSSKSRTKEIGIRKINGAKTWEIMLMLNMDFVKWVAIAFVIATPVAYFAMDRWLQNFAYRTALSWWIFVLAGILALAIALLTVSWQSWLAARRNPIDSLKYE
ncbi:MAG: ABC transporter permease [Tenuifilaceae bacterium]|nr:ABC transporter permease [Tenuifilaceae bacterium]